MSERGGLPIVAIIAIFVVIVSIVRGHRRRRCGHRRSLLPPSSPSLSRQANSAILNSLLGILNERRFDNGAERVEVPLLCLVAASNEPPESEELDALFDRFLLRREVGQLSPGGLAALLRAGGPEAGDSAARTASASLDEADGADAATAAPRLTEAEVRACRADALRHVAVPARVADALVDLRQHVQERSEPPGYVSDRRALRALQVLQVAAWTDGRTEVGEADLLLLPHLFSGRAPGDAERVREWVLRSLAEGGGGGNETTNIVATPGGGEARPASGAGRAARWVLAALFGRACRLGDTAEGGEGAGPEGEAARARLRADLDAVRSLLEERLVRTYRALGRGLPGLADGGSAGAAPDADAASTGAPPDRSLWLTEVEARSAAAALLPRAEKGRAEAERLLFDAVVLGAALDRGAEPVALAELLPGYWAEFIRAGPIEDVSPLGLG